MICFYKVQETLGKVPKSYKTSPMLCPTKTEVAKMPKLKSDRLTLTENSNQTLFNFSISSLSGVLR